MTLRLPIAIVLAAALLGRAGAAAAPAPDLKQMQQELEALKAKLAQMQQLEQRVQTLEAQIAQLRAQQQQPRPRSQQQQQQQQSAPAHATQQTTQATNQAENAPPERKVKLGGAIRFNYFYENFDAASRIKRGQSGLDLFRISADGSYRKLLFSAEYRWYPYMQTLHHGWVGYRFGDRDRIQAGITKVPFGLLPYAAHNFWFGVPYYLGLADDYDTGVEYLREASPWDLRVAFFKNGELGNAANLDRYSFDVVNAGGARNSETNTVNARFTYTFDAQTSCTKQVGLSALRGRLYNADTGEDGMRRAVAAHVDVRCGRWNVQLEAGRYRLSPRNPAGVPDSVVRVGAFATSYDIAAAGDIGVLNFAYNFPVHWGPVDQLTCYNDFSVLRKDLAGARRSELDTTGCALGIGPLFTYVDWIRAHNMVFFGNGSLAAGGDSGWDTRFNVNVGYYF